MSPPAGAGLALLDQMPRAAAASASALRFREDEATLRDAEHLAASAGETSPAGHVHRLCTLSERSPSIMATTTSS
ncbi:DUF1403 family protein [Methylosinus sporium]|uniref:DUF1403 family protein n=1 Tax=Methylosinus sporium TaxID=428 RepID=UPI00163D6D4E|nr:DUF1403 family protein [Methylosinus sporium]